MAATITWSISDLAHYVNSGGVIVAYWQATAVDGAYSASAYGTASFIPDPDSPDFIPYEDLTESDVLDWVYSRVNKSDVEESLTGKIEEDKTPAISQGVPW